jgi:hypothetical protein
MQVVVEPKAAIVREEEARAQEKAAAAKAIKDECEADLAEVGSARPTPLVQPDSKFQPRCNMLVFTLTSRQTHAAEPPTVHHVYGGVSSTSFMVFCCCRPFPF